MNWLETLSDAERETVYAALVHTVHNDEAPFPDEGDVLMGDLDATINGAEPGTFSCKIPEELRPVVWASMCAAILDVHAPQDNLTEHQWELASAIFDAFDAAETPAP